VALGPRGAQIGLTNVIPFVVFGGLLAGLAPAAEIGGLVFMGGALEMFVAAVPWLRPRFEPERTAIATVYRELAEYAGEPTGSAAAPPVSTTLLEARDLLSTPTADSSQLEPFWSLLNQAERIRLELTSLGNLLEQLTLEKDAASVDAVAGALRATRPVLSAIADTIQSRRLHATTPDPTQYLRRAAGALRAFLPVPRRAVSDGDAAVGEAMAA
jgi:hypothetical protein